MFFSFIASLLAGSPSSERNRTLAAEALEPREMLSADGLVSIGSQPSGALDDKIVYVHGGHGYTAVSGGWGYQRPLLLDMVEDLGNSDQMAEFVDYLWDAGATVVPLRPVGHQPNEVVIDNDDTEVTVTGSWGVGSGSIYFGESGDDPYLFATTSSVETATVSYRPNIPAEGFYPIYSFAPAGSNRAEDQLYRVHHSGGATEVTIDHSRVGNGLVYLGTFHFEAGTDGHVEISNRSDQVGRVVVADMIRFGNGVGDIDRGNGVSGQIRENEAGLYWVEWHVDRSQGIPTSSYRTSSDDRTATVSLAPRYATYMNQSGVGTLSDRVFVSFHSNAGASVTRGVLGLYNGNNRPSAATPNQFFLADTLASEVNDDMVAQNGSFEHNWFNNGNNVTLDRTDIEFGEINNERINNEFDATIIETGYHDNQLDAEMLRDPRVRDALARATYQGLIDYFRVVDGGATPDTDAPPAITDFRVETNASGSATLTWAPGTASSFAGDNATEYVVYASTNGFGFDGGTVIAGGSTTTTTLTGLDPTKTYYFRIAARNAGGESPRSEVLAARPSTDSDKILIVNGFDRLSRNLVPQEPFPGGGAADRIRLRNANSFDYVTQVAGSITNLGTSASIASASNEQVASGAVNLDDYEAVIWILGEESSIDDTFNPSEQTAVSDYLSQGGKLFVSGAEIGWDLDNLNNGRTFYNNSLRADYVADDSGNYDVSGTAGSIFEGINFSFDDGTLFYDSEFPDVINPNAGSSAALTYDNGAGNAAIQFSGNGGEQIVMLAFPFETITDSQKRDEVMGAVLDYFGFTSNPPVTLNFLLDNDDSTPTYTETGTWITSSDPGFGGGTQRFNLIGFAGTATWQTDLPFAGEAEVFVQFDAATNRATGSNFTVTSGSESFTTTVDQTQNDFAWVSLGTLDASSGPILVTLDALNSTGPANSLVIADVVRIDLTGFIPPNGDFNSDGDVNAADFTVWRDTLGDTVTPGTGADASNNGLIDQDDYDIWVQTYGLSVPVITPSTSESEPLEVLSKALVADQPESEPANTAAILMITESMPTPLEDSIYSPSRLATVEADRSQETALLAYLSSLDLVADHSEIDASNNAYAQDTEQELSREGDLEELFERL